MIISAVTAVIAKEGRISFHHNGFPMRIRWKVKGFLGKSLVLGSVSLPHSRSPAFGQLSYANAG